MMMLRPSAKLASPQPEPSESAATLSAVATSSLRDMIEAQGLSCPNALDGTLQTENPDGQVASSHSRLPIWSFSRSLWRSSLTLVHVNVDRRLLTAGQLGGTHMGR